MSEATKPGDHCATHDRPIAPPVSDKYGEFRPGTSVRAILTYREQNPEYDVPPECRMSPVGEPEKFGLGDVAVVDNFLNCCRDALLTARADAEKQQDVKGLADHDAAIEALRLFTTLVMPVPRFLTAASDPVAAAVAAIRALLNPSGAK